MEQYSSLSLRDMRPFTYFLSLVRGWVPYGAVFQQTVLSLKYSAQAEIS